MTQKDKGEKNKEVLVSKYQEHFLALANRMLQKIFLKYSTLDWQV